MQERALTNPKISIHYFRELDEVLGDDKQGRDRDSGADNQNGGTEEMPASGLFLAIGHTPNTAFLKGSWR